MITETIHKGTDNIISVELRSDGIAQAINSATKINLVIGDSTLSSATSASGVFDFTTYGASGRLDMKLGNDPSVLKMRNGQYKSKITVFDTTYPNGRFWDDLIIEVR